jgi:acyl dehydratase
MKALIRDDAYNAQTDFSDTTIPPAAQATYGSLKNKLGKETYLGEWYLLDQRCINQFAEATGDNQWIHTDSERAKLCSPFKSTIAHGFLTLALIPALTETIDPEKTPYPEAKMVMMYGLNKVRYLYPIKTGSRVRARIHLIGLTLVKQSIEVVNKVSIEVENRSHPACIAETVLRLRF